MKKYIELRKNNITLRGLIILGLGSILLGVAGGIIAFILSNFFYLFIIFPFFIGIFALVPYTKIVSFSKINHAGIAGICGVICGFLIAVSYFGTPFIDFRNKNITYLQENYQIDKPTASKAVSYWLKSTTGSIGLLGYMKLRANEGEEFSNYLMINAVVINTPNIKLNSTGLWINWFVETLCFILPFGFIVFSGKEKGKNIAIWTNSKSNQIGSIKTEDFEIFKQATQTEDWQLLRNIFQPEGNIHHPLIEIYTQKIDPNQKDNNNYLLGCVQTTRKNAMTVKRKTVQLWEITPEECNSLINCSKMELL